MQHVKQALTLSAATLLVAACGGTKDARSADTSVGAGTGGLSAPAVGAGGGVGGSVNGRGVTDSNAAHPAATSGTGAPSNSGLGPTTTGAGTSTSGTSTSGASTSGGSAGPGAAAGHP